MVEMLRQSVRVSGEKCKIFRQITVLYLRYVTYNGMRTGKWQYYICDTLRVNGMRTGKWRYYICDTLRVNGMRTGKLRYYICDTLCANQGEPANCGIYLQYATYKWHQTGKSRYHIYGTRNGTSAAFKLSQPLGEPSETLLGLTQLQPKTVPSFFSVLARLDCASASSQRFMCAYLHCLDTSQPVLCMVGLT